MHLLKPIAAGLRGARNGSAFVFLRGTNTPAPVYADNAGRVRCYSTHELDSLGSRELYVDALVDVRVLDENGSLVRAWTDGAAAGATVIDHDAFTAETLSEALDTLIESAGATDWNVLIGEDEQAVYAALGGSAGVFYTAGSFGATGAGTGDDWGPIQAAINAAANAGGGVVFLAAGTYPVSTALSLPTGVSLTGPGSGLVRIESSTGNESVLQLFGAAGNQVVRGIAFGSAAGMSEPLVYVGAVNSTFEHCLFDGDGCSGFLLVVSTPDSEGACKVSECEFLVVEPTTTAVSNLFFEGADAGRIWLAKTRFILPAEHTADGIVGIRDVHVDSCVFDPGASTTGSLACVFYTGDQFGIMDGIEVLTSGGAGVVAARLATLNDSGENEFAFEDCMVANTGDSHFSLYDIAETTAGYYARLKSVRARHSPIADNATARNSGLVHYIFPDASQYGVVSVKNEDATAGALSSGVCFGTTDSALYEGSVNISRDCAVIYALESAEDFLLSAPLENLTRNSCAPGWKSLAGSAHGMVMCLMPGYAQSPSVGNLTRWHCIGQSSGQPTVDTVNREGYVF